MRQPKNVSAIADGVNRRFFEAIEALIAVGRLRSLHAFCKEFKLNDPRYREMRFTYGVAPNHAKTSRYKLVEIEAIFHLCNSYDINAEWMLLGKGKMFKNEVHGKI